MTDPSRTGAFDEFFLDEFPRLVAMLTAWCGDRATAEDLAQDALLQAQQRWSDVRALDNPGAWVRRVALNRSSNEGRRRRREHRAVTRWRSRFGTVHAPPDVLPDGDLWRRVRELSPSQRDAIVLRYVDDLPLGDIAAVLGCSAGTVKTHLQRGRLKLAGALDTDDTPTEDDRGPR